MSAAAAAAARAVMLPEILSDTEVAQHLRMPVLEVRRLFATHALPGRKLGDHWFTSRVALLRELGGAGSPGPDGGGGGSAGCAPDHDGDRASRCLDCGGELPIPEQLKLLDTEMLRRILGLETRQGVRDMVDDGRLPSVRLGREHKVRQVALVELFERQERSPEPSSPETAKAICKRLGRTKRRP